MIEVADGLYRWTAFHPDWEEEVGCLALETDEGLVLVDPLDPPRRFSKPKHVLITVYWHGRATGRIAARHVWAPSRGARPLQNRGVHVTDAIRNDTTLPGGLCAVPTARAGEVVYWLPQQKALAVGDVLLGAGAKPRATSDPLRLCPERWLGKATHADLRASLEPLLDLPIQRVLLSHGAPVLRDGKRELARALA